MSRRELRRNARRNVLTRFPLRRNSTRNQRRPACLPACLPVKAGQSKAREMNPRDSRPDHSASATGRARSLSRKRVRHVSAVNDWKGWNVNAYVMTHVFHPLRPSPGGRLAGGESR